MTDFYCDHGVYTSALGTTPTWGVPQEGDGTTKDAATASSVASVDLTSITSTAGTFSIFGSAAISVGASASGATLAAQIVSAINGSTQTTGNTSIFPGAPQLRNAFFARNTGATLEIMCRIGTALTNVLGMTWAGTWSAGPPSNLTFSGGSGGCWGWFINPSAIGVSSSIAIVAYGVWLAKPYVGAVPTIDDEIWTRTGGGASKTISIFNVTAFATLHLNHADFSSNIVADSNTKWTGDIATGVLKVQLGAHEYQNVVRVTASCTNRPSSIVAIRRGGFEFEGVSGWNSVSSAVFINMTNAVTTEYYKNVTFRRSGNTSGWSPVNIPDSSYGHSGVYECCDFLTRDANTVVYQIAGMNGYNASQILSFIGCTFDFNISGVANPGDPFTVGSQYDSRLTIKDCAFLGYSSGYRICTSAALAANASTVTITVENCSGLAMPGAYTGWPTATLFPEQSRHQITTSNMRSVTAPGMRVEDTRGVAEWIPDASPAPPTLSATVLGTGAAWSMCLKWIAAAVLTDGRPYAAPTFRAVTQLAAGVKTVTVELFLPSTVSRGLRMSIGYIDTTGVSRSDASDVLQSSSAVWTGAANYPGYTSKKFVIVTSYSVAEYSEIAATVKIVASIGASVDVYVDPEFGVA